MDQRSAEWFEARRGKITASGLSAVMAGQAGKKPTASRRNYLIARALERVTGEIQETYTNRYMDDGIEQEPFARAQYEAECGVDVVQVGFIDHPEIPMFGASPDGLVSSDGLVEFKCPIPATHYDTWQSRRVPNDYTLQMQGQMMCTRRAWDDFASYNKLFPLGARLVVIRVEADAEQQRTIEQAVRVANKEIEMIVKSLTQVGSTP